MTDTTTDVAAALIAGTDTIHEIEDTLRREAARLLKGTAADIDAWISRLATMMTLALAEGSETSVASIKRQARLLAEIQRVRANDATWASFLATAETIVSAALRVTVGLLTSGAIKLQDTDE